MMLDAQSTFSNQLALTAVGTSYSDAIDLGGRNADGSVQTDALGNTPISDPGRADIELVAQVTETFATAAGGTLQVDLVTADNAGLTTNPVVLQSTGVLAAATLVAGYRFRLGRDLPPGISKRYVGLKYTVGTGVFTAGKVTAALAIDSQLSAPSV